MKSEPLNRREFLEHAALAAGALAIAAGVPSTARAATATTAPAAAGKRAVSDLVPLGNTGLKVSRLGLGLGSNNGAVQAALGQEGFNTLIKHAFDQGVTLLDTAQNYRTFKMIAPAIKGLPREKVFIQSKIEEPGNILDVIDMHRKTFNTDYVDSMLVHIQYKENWTDTWKRAMEGFDAAREKKWILSKGVSCHSLPALRAAIASDWTQVHLVRINPQGVRMDNEQQVGWGARVSDPVPILAELKKMKEKQRGVIGMKIFGNGEFKTDAEREQSARHVMARPEVDAIVVGFANIEQLDKGITLFNKALAEAV